MKVFSFDRDGTIDVNPLSPEHESIPLKWVQYLAHETEHEVWAHGNQKLKREAGIPGQHELIQRYKKRWGDPIKHVNDRQHKDLELELSVTHQTKPDPDLVTAAAEWEKGGNYSKQQHLRLLEAIFPDADEYICVDNQYLGYVPGWTFYYPNKFVEEFSSLENEIESLDPDWEVPPTEFGSGKQDVRRTTKVVSRIGKKLPRRVRDRFELDPSKRIPIRFRRR